MNTAKIVLFAIKTKKGTPIRLRYYVDNKAKYVNLGYYLTDGEKKRYWNETKKELRKSYPYYDEVHEEFEKQKTKLLINVPKNNNSFVDYFQNFIDTLTITKQYGLRQKCISTLKHLKNHSGGDVLFSNLNVTYLNSLKLYFTKNNISPVAQKGYFEKIRKQINNAIVEDVYAPTKHPFLGFEFNKINTKPKHLTKPELEYLKTFKSNTPHREKARIRWMFQYYSFGMRVSDLLQLRFSDIKENGARIEYIMFKTKHSMNIALTPDLINLIFEYIDVKEMQRIALMYFMTDGIKDEKGYYQHLRNILAEYASNNQVKSNRIFSNIVPKATGEQLYSNVSTQTGVYNRQLKELSTELNDTDKKYNYHLTTHQARHTFAYISILQNKSIYYISKALNHQSVKTTEKYIRSFDKGELDGMFYDKELASGDKKEIDDKLKQFIEKASYDDKKKLIDFIEMI